MSGAAQNPDVHLKVNRALASFSEYSDFSNPHTSLEISVCDVNNSI